MTCLSSPFLRGLAAACLAWLAIAAHAGTGQEFLDPEQAFPLTVTRSDEHTLALRFDIAPGYRMYRERFAFDVPAATTAVQAELPPGNVKFDETFQKEVETYSGSVTLPVRVAKPTASFMLSVTSQGCADQGLCYPPQVRSFKVDVANGAVAGVQRLADGAQVLEPAAVAAPVPPSETGRIQSVLQTGSLLVIAGVFAAAGLLLSFTPCVLPMVPILSSIIVGQAGPLSRARSLGLSASYCLGMALVYTAFGVAAGLLGEGLAAALQNAWVLGAFALLLAGLSLSMFGLYELQMPGAVQNKVSAASGRIKGGTFAGVFVMGGMSALIVGPCVAAPLAGALVYISRTHDVLIGGVALFSLACGMSAPLLLVGLSAGSLLPRAGAWMEKVKHAFGVLLLAVALWLVSPVLPAWALMALAGALLLMNAVYLGAFERLPDTAGGWRRFFKGVGVLLALVGAAEFLGALSGGRDALQPLAHLAARSGGAASADPGQPDFTAVHSLAELDAAVAAAGKPVMLDFYADWCVSCKEYEKVTFADEDVRRKLREFVLLRADVTANTANDKALLKRFELFGPPAIVFFDSQGRENTGARVVGYQPGRQFLGSLNTAAP